MPAKLFQTAKGLAYYCYKSNPQKKHLSYISPVLDAMINAKKKLDKPHWRSYRHEGDAPHSNI
jgi:hypothetical protein